ncbi:hypothetical protein WA158_006204 [Blastocystis sp. Blastoise]
MSKKDNNSAIQNELLHKERLVEDSEKKRKTETKRSIIFLYITLAMDIAGFSLVLPLVPYIIKDLNGGSIENGVALSGYAILQYVSSVIFGKISDRYGRKICIVITILGQLIGTIFQLSSNSVWLFVAARVITGIFDDTYSLSQAAIADITKISERATYLAQIDAIYSCGYMIGPLIGGYLSEISYTTALWAAVGIYTISFLCSIFLLKETVPTVNEIYIIQKKIKQLEKKPNISSKSVEGKLRLNTFIILALVEEFCNKWVCTVIDSSFGLYGEAKYDMTGLVFSIVNVLQGAVNALQQGYLYGFFLKKLQLNMITIVLMGGVIDVLGMFVCIFAPNLPVAIFGAVLLSIGFGFTSPCGSSIISCESSPEAQGRALSLVLAGGASSQAICPLVLGVIFNVNMELPFYVSMGPSALIIILMIIFFLLPGGKYAGIIPSNELALSGNLENQKVINKKLSEYGNPSNELELSKLSTPADIDQGTTEESKIPVGNSILLDSNDNYQLDTDSVMIGQMNHQNLYDDSLNTVEIGIDDSIDPNNPSIYVTNSSVAPYEFGANDNEDDSHDYI